MSAKQPRKPHKSKVPEPGSIEARRCDVVAKLGATFGILDDPAELRPVGPGNGVLHYGVFVSVGIAEQILNRLDTLLAALDAATADNPQAAAPTGHTSDWLRTLPPSLAADLQSTDALRRATALASATERELRGISIAANHEAAKGNRA